MEEAQIQHIKKNLVELVKNTTCSSAFIEVLTRRKILEPSQVTMLESLGLTSSEKSEKLYEILTEQADSFDVLIQSLELTQQTQALKLLLNCTIFGNSETISYDKTKELRTGGFNGERAYLGKFGGRAVAVKVVHADVTGTKLTLREVEMLKKLDSHENIVRFFTVEAREGFIQTALELFEITLQDAIKLNRVNKSAVKILTECTTGLAHIHSMRVIHTDLSPANIVFKGNGPMKICNFGLAQQLTCGMESIFVYSENNRNKDWMAPEMLKYFVEEESERHLIEMSGACDVFSLGCIFFFVLTKGSHPFGSPILRQSNVYYDDKAQLENATLDSNWEQLIMRMISHASQERPSIVDVLLVDSCFKEEPCNSASHSYCTCYKFFSSIEKILLMFQNVNFKNYSKIIPASPDKDNVMYTEEPAPSTSRLPIQPDPDLNTQNEALLPLEEMTVAVSTAKRPLATAQNFLVHIPCSSIKLKRKRTDVHNPAGEDNTRHEIEELDRIDDEGNNTLFRAVLNGRKLEELTRIVDNGSDIRWTNFDGESILHLAVNHKNSEVIKYLITAGADVNAKDDSGELPIHKLKNVKINFKEKLAVLIENGAEINAVDENGNTILGLAASSGRTKGDLEFLMGKTADWKHKNYNQETVLHLAVDGGNINAIKLFFKLGLKIVKDKNGETAMHRVRNTNTNFKGVVDTLLYHGASINAADKDGDSVLGLAAWAGKSKEDLKYIISKGAKLEAKNQRKETILHWAAKGGNPEAIKYLIELGASINLKGCYGVVPLHCIAFARLEFMKSLDVLLENGADINVQDIDGYTLLSFSTAEGRPREDLEYIIERGGDWQLRNKLGESVLHCAAKKGNIEAMHYFVSLGLPIDLKCNKERLPLHQVARNKRNFKISVDELLAFGSNINATDKYGNTLLILSAEEGKDKDILEYLIYRGADWKMKNKFEQTILHFAAWGGNVEAIKFILGLGSKVNAKDVKGEIPLHFIARTKGNLKQCLDTFLEQGAKINTVNKKGCTLLDLVVKNKRVVEDLDYIESKGGTGKLYDKIFG